MKKNIHPKYQQILFVDSATGHKFVCGSTLHTEAKETFQGVEYPMYKVSVSSASHPFFTGSKGLVDAEGRVDKFKKRYAARTKSLEGGSEEQEQPKEQSQDEQPKEKHPKEHAKVHAKEPAKKTAKQK